MSTSVFSSSWYRVADLVPRLRAHAQIHRMRFRGRRWYLLQDHTSGRFHRFSPAAHVLIGLMDGRRSMAEVWALASERLGDDLPTQDETIRLMSQLYRANALATDAFSNVEELVERDESTRSRQFWANFRSPLAIKLPLFDPTRLLDAIEPLGRAIFAPWGLVLWLATVLPALALAFQHWAALTEGLADRVLALENALLLWLAFPVVKVLHEFGHGLAIRRWGGETHEVGVMFLVGVPVPFIDATASSAFPSRLHRAIVGAAGVFVELFVAALAMFVWVTIEPGAVRAIAFNVMLIAGVSSLLFNGNPFLRFDAYYVFSDLLEIPNLGSRANQWWGYAIQRHVFGRVEAESPADSASEAAWLAVYAVGALVNRLLITLSIALFVASELFFIGVLIATWSVAQFAVLPVVRHVGFVLFDPKLRGVRRRALGWTLGSLAVLIVLLGFVPAPSWTMAEGVVWAREDALVRAGTDGVIEAFVAEPGRFVEPGEQLVRLSDSELSAELAIAEATVRAHQAQYDIDRTADRVQAEITRQSLAHAERRLARATEEIEALDVVAGTAGRFLVDAPTDQIGRFLRRGEVLGYVLAFDPLIVRTAVAAQDVDFVRNRTRSVEVRLAERLDAAWPARIVLEVPAATSELPSRALSTDGGGEIALDPSAQDGLRAYESHFLFDLAVDGVDAPVGVGGRVHVRFQHEPEPVLLQLYRAARRLFLSQFNV